MNIFLRELKANLKSLVIWSLIIALLVLVGTAKFAAFAGDPSSLAMMDALPAPLVAAMNLNAFNLTTVGGFFGILFLYFALMGAIAAAMWGSDMISKEERDRTVEFSLVLPVSRNRVVTAKALAALADCAAFVLVTWGMSLVAARPYAPDRGFHSFLALEMLAMFCIELVFLAVGLLLGCAMRRHKLSGSTAVAVILVSYFLSVLSSMQKNLDFLRYVTPFRYFDAAAMHRSGSLDGVSLLLSGGIVVACVAAAYWRYNRRDLYI